MINIQITEEADNYDDIADILRRIAKMIDEGYRSGYYPTWDLEGREEPEEDDKTTELKQDEV